jgi:hypothetical protein
VESLVIIAKTKSTFIDYKESTSHPYRKHCHQHNELVANSLHIF